MSKFPFLTVVFACYKPTEILQESISVLLDNIDEQQIVLVNNGSRESLGYLQAEFPRICILQNRRNIGFGRSMNRGMELALSRGSRYVLLLNQDLAFEPTALQRLVEAAEAREKFAVLSPVCMEGAGVKLDAKFSTYLSQSASVRTFGKDEVVSVPFVNAAAWLIDAGALDIGGFDPLFFMYSEDDDFAGRIRESGREIGIVMSSKARHTRDHACSPSRRSAIKRSSEMLLSVKNRHRSMGVSVCREIYGSARILLGLSPSAPLSIYVTIWSICLFLSRLKWFIDKDRCRLVPSAPCV